MRRNAILLEDVEIIPWGKNFTGKEQRYNGQIVNSEGNQNFLIKLPLEFEQQFIDDGWDVGILHPENEGDQPRHYMKIRISYQYEPYPRVSMYTASKGVRTDFDQEDLYNLDEEDIIHADVSFTPWRNKNNPDAPIKAYLDELRVVVQDSSSTMLDEKYANMWRREE